MARDPPARRWAVGQFNAHGHSIDGSGIAGLEAAGVAIGYPRAAALNWLSNANPGSVEAMARQATELAACRT